MSDAVQQSAVIVEVVIEDAQQHLPQRCIICLIRDLLTDALHHLDHAQVGTAVARTFQRTDRGADRRIEIRSGRSDDDVGKGGVVAAAVICVQHQQHIERL